MWDSDLTTKLRDTRLRPQRPTFAAEPEAGAVKGLTRANEGATIRYGMGSQFDPIDTCNSIWYKKDTTLDSAAGGNLNLAQGAQWFVKPRTQR